jgi:serine/threonine-protein kinase
MSAAVDCPEFASWPALLDDALPPDERAHYERHLEDCPLCQGRLDNCDDCDESWRRLARQTGDPTTVPADPTLTQVIERCRREGEAPAEPRTFGSAGALPSRSVEPLDLYFLHPTDRPGVLGTLGNYEVQSVIGQGGMGVVLKAYEPALHRLVAIKVLAAAVAGSATARRRFTREAQAAAAVCHEHIVPVHGVFEADGLPYLVMQYVAGESLQGRLDRTGPLEVTEIVRIAHQTADGLAAAHAQGLIHRDIKPANLLLENGLARVKITDFGLARMTDDAPVTQPGVLAGTPEYMAPEQARGEPVDHRADLFSLGSVIYAMCTGRPPFRAASAVAVLRQVSDEEPAPVRTLNSDAPEWLAAVVARLMAKDPAERFESAAEVADLFEGFLAHLRQPATVPAPPLASLGRCREPSGTPGPARLAGATRRSRVRRLAVLAIGVAAVVYGSLLLGPRGGGPEQAANPASIDLYQDFRQRQPLKDGFGLVGVDAEQFTAFETDGYRIRLPATRQVQAPLRGVGVATGREVAGDFQITAGYVFLSAGAVSGADVAGVDLFYKRGPDGKRTGRIGRFNTAAGPAYEVYDSTYRPPPSNKLRVPTQAMKGELRLARQGRILSYAVKDETTRGEFQELFQADFGLEPLTLVLFEVNPGAHATPVDVRLIDLRIRSGAQAPAAPIAAPPVPTAAPPPSRPSAVEWLFQQLGGQKPATPPPPTAAPVPSAAPSTFDVWSVATSQDGKFVAAGGGLWAQPGEIGVWEMGTFKPLQRFQESGGVASVAFSPDGKLLASGSWDGHVRVREWASGKQVADFETGTVARVAFSPNGEMLATASEAQAVQLWDVAHGQLIAELDGDRFRFHCVAFSPDGKRVFAGGGDWGKVGASQVNVYDVASRKQIQKLTGHDKPILSIAFSHGGKQIATAAVDQTVRLWDAESGKPLKTMNGHAGMVQSAAFAADDKTVVSGGLDGTIRIWDVEKATEVKNIGSPVPIRTVHLTAGGNQLFVGGSQKLLLVLDATSHKQLAVLWNGIPAPTKAAAAIEALPPAGSSSGRHKGWLTAAIIGGLALLLALAVRAIVRHGRLTESRSKVPPGNALPRGSASPSPPEGGGASRPPDRRRSFGTRARVGVILSSALLGIGLILFMFARSNEANGPSSAGDRRIKGHAGPVHNVRFLPDGRLLSGSGYPGGDRTLRLWDVAGGRELNQLTLPHQVHALDVSPDGRFALVGLGNGEIAYVDLETFQSIRLLRGHRGAVGWLGFAADGQTAFSAGSDGTARIWNLTDGAEVKQFAVVNPRARGAALFPDGKRLLTADGGGLLQIWDIVSGQELKRFQRDGFIDSVAVLADGKQALVTGNGGAGLYDLESRELRARELRAFQEDGEEVHQAAVSPDGRLLLTASFDGKARLWSFQSGKLIRDLGTHDGVAFAAAFSPDGRWAASAGDARKEDGKLVPATDHDIRLWDLSGGAVTAAPATRRPWLTAASGIILLIALAFAGVWYVGRNGRRARNLTHAAPLPQRGRGEEEKSLEPSPPSPLGNGPGGLGLRRAAWLLAAAPGVVGCALLSMALRPEPRHESTEFTVDLRGGRELAPPFHLVGPDAETVARPEDGGLRITLPAGRPPGQRDGVGVQGELPAMGDFEITATYELLAIEEPQEGYGVGVMLTAWAGPHWAKIARCRRIGEGDVYYADHGVRGNGRVFDNINVPSTARAGRLRLLREGTVLRGLAAEGTDSDFREVFRSQFGGESVGSVRFVVNSGNSPAAVDARLVDLTIREGGHVGGRMAKTWLFRLGILGLAISGASGGWLYRRNRRTTRTANAKADPATAAPPLLAVKCPGCERGLKAKSEMAGKTAKCPHCGHAVAVPNGVASKA